MKTSLLPFLFAYSVSFVFPISAAEFTGTVVDADTGAPIPARVYVQTEDAQWLYVKSASPDGSALPYLEQWVPMPGSVERHTTISAHPFQIDLNRGRYTFTIERGKEYFPLTQTVVVDEQPQQETFHLRRWVNIAERGWYSGETHVHRRICELANVQLAEDLNVTFPVTFWTVQAYEAPGLEPSPLRRQGPSPFGPRVDYGSDIIEVDATHVMFPRNTEYEIFSVGENRHVLGAVFILNHRTVFQEGMPPVAKIAERAHTEGALLDLDKHNWPWSMMLVPIAKVDLYELSNNSVWRTKFGFRGTTTRAADYMDLETDEGGLTEWGWLNFGFENYYALLNCGFRLQPTAGTASGVHPVPLGHSRVYVHLPDGFDARSWTEALRNGRSFVTTGPMLFAKVDGKPPGTVFKQPRLLSPSPRRGGPRRGDVESQHGSASVTYSVQGQVVSERPLGRIEILVNGEVLVTIKPQPRKTPNGAYATSFTHDVSLAETSWIAVRCAQHDADDRVRFAHTAPWHVQVADQPIRPREEQINFLIRRVQDEIQRNQDILRPDALAEFRDALRIYQEIARRRRTTKNTK